VSDILARLSGPGAFRLWLALLVVLHHFTRIEFGKAPVLVFFALSGFWVHRVWPARYAVTRLPYLTFIVSRWWRLAPVLLVSSAIAFTVMAGLGEADQLHAILDQGWLQLAAATAGLGYAQLAPLPLLPAWSLDVEMQYYLIAPLMMFAVRRLSWIVALTLAIIVQLLALMLVPETLVTSYLSFFVVGMLAAQHDWRPPRRMARAGLALAAGATVIALASPWQHVLLSEGGDGTQLFSIGLAVMMLPFALHTSLQPSDRIDSLLADHSYSVYLLHWPAVLVFRHVPWEGQLQALCGAAGLFAVIALTSGLVLKTIDRPLQKRRSKWVHIRRSTAPVANTATKPKTGDIASQFA